MGCPLCQAPVAVALGVGEPVHTTTGAERQYPDVLSVQVGVVRERFRDGHKARVVRGERAVAVAWGDWVG